MILMKRRPRADNVEGKLNALFELTAQTTSLLFFTVFMLAVLLLVNYYTLLSVNLVITSQNLLALNALVIVLIVFAIILVLSIQLKRSELRNAFKK